jgi:capsular polysaccharide biosynthesis protein
VELNAYMSAIKAGWKIVLGALVVAVAVAALLSWRVTPSYASSTSLFVAAENGSENLNELYLRNALSQQRVASYAALAETDSVAAEVSKEVGFPVSAGAVTSVVLELTLIVQLTVTDGDPERAHAIATGYGEVLPRVVADLEQVGDTSEAPVELTVIDTADLPGAPTGTPVMRNFVAAVIFGLGAGIGIAVLRYVLVQEKKRAASGVGAS